VIPVGGGRASLGTLKPGYRPTLAVKDERPRCIVVDPELGELNLSVTDARVHELGDGDGWSFSARNLENLANRIGEGTPAFLSVGLGRPWPRTEPAHWLQVNGIHVEPDEASRDRAYSVDAIRQEHPNAYQAWTEDEEQLLTRLHEQGLTVRQIGKILGRQDGGIKSRLKRLGLTD
jgi:hypothetical protein